MRKMSAPALFLILSVITCLPLMANDPPAGGLLFPVLGSPLSSGSGPSATFLDAPWADRLNPASSAAQQRPVLDLGLGLLCDFGTQGVGAAVNLGTSLPTAYGVWGLGLTFLTAPGTMTDLPLGTVFQLRGGIAKDLYPNFHLGAALAGMLGADSAGFGWGLGLDLGLMHKLGDLGFLKDFRYGAVLSGLGKGYSTPGSTKAWPAPFTFSTGARALLVRSDGIKAGLGLDLSFPGFQDIGFGLSGSLVFWNVMTLRAGWGLPSIVELASQAGSAKSLLPSFALQGSFALKGKDDGSFLAKQGWDQSELRPALSFTPLYGSVSAVSTGLTVPLGVVDTKGPDIEVAFPASEWGPPYLSPNDDGKFDNLEFPVKVSDRRYIAAWVATVVPEAGGDPLRTMANKDLRPGTTGLAEFWRRLTYVKTGVPVPDTITWNGFGDSGERVPDGAYSLWLEARDDNGNVSKAGPFAVVVDVTPPAVEFVPEDESLVFSPDGDGNKDTFTITMTGSAEDLWTLRILDAAGTLLRSAEFRDSAPGDFIWDGKTDTGPVVPDGVYSLTLSSTDRAGNSVTRRLDNIVVNTLQPPINISIGDAAFSPNGDGVKDNLAIELSVPVRNGLVSWRLSVVDRQKREVFGLGSGDEKAIPARFLFDGKGSDGTPLPEDSYQARLAVTYRNGHAPVTSSPLFSLDVTPPSATVAADRSSFNAAGEARQNRVVFTQSGSEEERWTGELIAAAGAVARAWTWSGKPEQGLNWDGTDDAGASVPDGDYLYRLRSTDRAGNSFVSKSLPVALDTEKKILRLGVDLRAFSPNADGTKDAVTLSDSVTANGRVRSWRLGVHATDEQGKPDRSRAVRAWTGTAEIPATFVWKGERDDGTKAPDGRYVALLEARYANDDQVEVQTLPMILDTVAPSVTASASALLFSPNEDSSLKTTTITQKSAPGDDWEGRMVDQSGAVARAWAWKGQVETIVWDATDDAGNKVNDGTYRYEVSSTDAAGNRGSATIPAIRVDARKPQVSVTTSSPAFSPNGDGVLDIMTLALEVAIKEDIAGWKFEILDASGAARVTRTGTGVELPPPQIPWDGKGGAPEGSYRARLAISYKNGNNPVTLTPAFILDVTAPVATLKADRSAFNPAGAVNQNRVTFTQTGSEEDRWTGEILGVDGTARRTWTWKPGPEAAIAWDGTDDAGAAVPDGSYSYRLRATDKAGNAFVSQPMAIALDTEKKTARLAAELRAFSPNGDGVKDGVALSAAATGNVKAGVWKVGVYTANEAGQALDRGKVQKTWTGNGAVPATFAWSGRRDDNTLALDGRYVAIIELRWPNGDSLEAATLPIILDTVAPSIKVSALPLLFSPAGQSRLKASTISQKAAPGDDWEARLLDSAGGAVRSWSFKGQVTDIVWDATDAAGNRVKDGAYRYEVASTDAAGNATKAATPEIRVDSRAPQVFVTASATGLSPNGDGAMDDLTFGFIVNLREGVSSWTFTLADSKGTEVASLSLADSELPSRLVWDGKAGSGAIVEGVYTGVFKVDYLKGDQVEARTGPVTVDVTAPFLELSVRPDFFSPDNDGSDDELTMGVSVRDSSDIATWKLEIDEASIEETPGAQSKERMFASWGGAGMPAPAITWDGRSAKGELVESATDYPFFFEATDIYGNKARLKGNVAIDVLVIREGERLKIKVPSIVFRANAADFNGLDADTVANNQKVAGRVAEILNKFKDYRIQIEGHANSIGKIYGYSAAKIADEEQKELVPLSTQRAELVRQMLVKAGVDARRLSVVGQGSSQPVVDFKDAVNRWKNRRVEFILIKSATAPAGSGG